MNIEEIMQCLPHRYPFLLVDKVLEIEVNKSILAVKNVTINEPFFQGHFPIKPVMPGVLIIESMAQAAGILAYKSTDLEPHAALFYLASIGELRFKKMIVPGDQLNLHIEVLKRRRNLWKFACEALVGGEVVCANEMTCMQGKVE